MIELYPIEIRSTAKPLVAELSLSKDSSEDTVQAVSAFDNTAHRIGHSGSLGETSI